MYVHVPPSNALHVPRMKWISSNRVSAIFIVRTLFLVFAKVTLPKMSSKVIPQNDSSNNLLSAVFLVKSGKTMALIQRIIQHT